MLQPSSSLSFEIHLMIGKRILLPPSGYSSDSFQAIVAALPSGSRHCSHSCSFSCSTRHSEYKAGKKSSFRCGTLEFVLASAGQDE